MKRILFLFVALMATLSVSAQKHTATSEELKEGFKVLFDGTSMKKWTGNLEGYQMQD